MSRSRKYRSFGVLRNNNLSDIQNGVAALNNILRNSPGVGGDISFISEDLDVIRGLKDTNINRDSFLQLRGSAVVETVLSSNNVFSEVVINPLIRLEDRFRQYRTVTGNPPYFASGQGPKAYFIPSNLLPSNFTKETKIDDEVSGVLSDPLTQTSDDFWMLGEFSINDRFRPDFLDGFGGILWEGYFIPNPATTTHGFNYTTSGLYHVEYDRFSDGDWEVAKSIYAKKRNVLVSANVTSDSTVILNEGEGRYVSVGDILDANTEIQIIGISGDTITLDNDVTFTAGQELTFSMPLGEESVSGQYVINEILDRAETPQMKLRIFWWFPNDNPSDFKYLRTGITGRFGFDYFFMNQEPASNNYSSGSIAELLDIAITPSQEKMGDQSEYTEFKSKTSTETLYVPKSSLSEIIKDSITISFNLGNRSTTGNFSQTEIGNIIVPQTSTDLGSVIPKNMRIKNLLASNVTSNARIVNQVWPESRSSYAVNVIDHNGLIDYFVVPSSSDNTLVTVSDTSRLRRNLICITSSTGSDDFIYITEIVNSTQFRTSANLNISADEYLFVYSNAGILDRSLDVFCVGVFGQVTANTASQGTNTLELISATGITNGQVVQFGSDIATNTTVTNVSGTTITLSQNIVSEIKSGETIVFAPAGTTVNKEICVLPLDLSPPFIGVDSGLDTGGKSISSSADQFNLKVLNLSFDGEGIVQTVSSSENYNRLIRVKTGNQIDTFSIISTKI
jgi:hypothetical protein